MKLFLTSAIIYKACGLVVEAEERLKNGLIIC